ncbi:MAG TPA: M20/M25/M40 family metallo-hydrolase [Longimicrobiales bacterium]|nr:M20/M25/M40 family metallo-hydrolase [Longimicrobiales bacterium]
MEPSADKRIANARRRIRQTDDQTIAEQLAIVAIAAPPFNEGRRGEHIAARFREFGYSVTTDEIGNVIAASKAARPNEQPIIIAAHLDTVFPDETITVRKASGRISAPGIADNSRGLAAMLTLARVCGEQELTTARPVVFVATVGEEGLGDLRGVKHLFRAGSPYRAAHAFISLDGTGRRRIVYRAIGSRRFRITMTGAGGHSWADWGVANPVHALGLAIGGIHQIETPRTPRTSLTVGRVAGGTSVNAIPEEAWCELDLRSEASTVLIDVEAEVRRIAQSALDHVNAHRKRGSAAIKLDIRVIGDRPSGETSVHDELIRAARSATRVLGDTPELVASSTDANIPIALGIPAIAIGAGGESGGTHTAEEWYSNEGGPEGVERAMLILLDVAGLNK